MEAQLGGEDAANAVLDLTEALSKAKGKERDKLLEKLKSIL